MSWSSRASAMGLAILAVPCLVASCHGIRATPGQVLVVVDTDAPAMSQAIAHAELSADAAIDTLRVDLIDADLRVFDAREIDVHDASVWPISFGIAPPSTPGTPVYIRARLFQRRFAVAGQIDGFATLDPTPSVTVDRLAVVVPDASEVVKVRLLLAEDCLGVPPSFAAPSTCVDGAHLSEPPTSGIEVLSGTDLPPSVVGTWPGAKEIPCTGAVPADRVCIPGGFSILGRAELDGCGTDEGPLSSSTLRPVLLEPFVMDRAEFTVARYNQLAGSPESEPNPYDEPDPYFGFCTWLPGGASPTGPEAPVNCVYWATARWACQQVQGDLPTEAQWEHAARGRGQRRCYPWGATPPTCCTTSASRLGPVGLAAMCSAESGVEVVGSHVGDCLDGEDRSRDGVEDLGGSVSEAMLDNAIGFLDPTVGPCGQSAGILRDPVCTSPGSYLHVSRGGNWYGPLIDTRATLRRVFEQDPDSMTPVSITGGFRCVYPAP